MEAHGSHFVGYNGCQLRAVASSARMQGALACGFVRVVVVAMALHEQHEPRRESGDAECGLCAGYSGSLESAGDNEEQKGRRCARPLQRLLRQTRPAVAPTTTEEAPPRSPPVGSCVRTRLVGAARWKPVPDVCARLEGRALPPPDYRGRAVPVRPARRTN